MDDEPIYGEIAKEALIHEALHPSYQDAKSENVKINDLVIANPISSKRSLDVLTTTISPDEGMQARIQSIRYDLNALRQLHPTPHWATERTADIIAKDAVEVASGRDVQPKTAFDAYELIIANPEAASEAAAKLQKDPAHYTGGITSDDLARAQKAAGMIKEQLLQNFIDTHSHTDIKQLTRAGDPQPPAFAHAASRAKKSNSLA